MPTILAGADTTLSLTVLHDGLPLALSGAVSAMVVTLDARTQIVPAFELDPDAAGAEWDEGVVVVALPGDATDQVAPADYMLVLRGSFGAKRFGLTVESLAPGVRTSLFIRDMVVDEIRRDRLMAAAASVLSGIQISDEYIWRKVLAAEADIASTLRVPLVPTRFFPNKPSAEDVAALDGMAWGVDPAYDYSPDMFRNDQWGYMVTRNKPLIEVQKLRLAYPSETTGFVDIPVDWLRVDAKYGHVRIVPASPAVFVSMNAFIMTALTSGRMIPQLMQLHYTAGLEDAATRYPQLLDVITKAAVMKIVEDSFLPSSGSISGDGLSESMSVDMEKYRDTVDHVLNGPKGSNGGLMALFHGIRMMVA
jgi:hypothetical protein